MGECAKRNDPLRFHRQGCEADPIKLKAMPKKKLGRVMRELEIILFLNEDKGTLKDEFKVEQEEIGADCQGAHK